MAKFRKVHCHDPWTDWWELAFDHYPWGERNTPSTHLVHCYKLNDWWPPPEQIWYWDFPTKELATNACIDILRRPDLLARVCYCCKNCTFLPPDYIQWNLQRGESHIWKPLTTIFEAGGNDPWTPPGYPY